MKGDLAKTLFLSEPAIKKSKKANPNKWKQNVRKTKREKERTRRQKRGNRTSERERPEKRSAVYPDRIV